MRRFFAWFGNHIFGAFLGATVATLISLIGSGWVRGLFAAITESWQAFVTWFVSDVPVPRWVLFLASTLLLAWLWIYSVPRIRQALTKPNPQNQNSPPVLTIEPSRYGAFGTGPGAAALQRALEANPTVMQAAAPVIAGTSQEKARAAGAVLGQAAKHWSAPVAPGCPVTPGSSSVPVPRPDVVVANMQMPNATAAHTDSTENTQISNDLLIQAAKHAAAATSSNDEFSFEEHVLLTIAKLGPSPVNEQPIIKATPTHKGQSVRMALIMLREKGLITQIPGPKGELNFWTLTLNGAKRVRQLCLTH